MQKNFNQNFTHFQLINCGNLQLPRIVPVASSDCRSTSKKRRVLPRKTCANVEDMRSAFSHCPTSPFAMKLAPFVPVTFDTENVQKVNSRKYSKNMQIASQSLIFMIGYLVESVGNFREILEPKINFSNQMNITIR